MLSPHLIKYVPKAFITGVDWDGEKPSIVLASGRKAVSVALHFKDSFTVFIQDPKIDPAHFDLVAAPIHDELKGENVIQTVAAPNRITTEKLAQARTDFPQFKSEARKIAVLIGGNSKAHIMPEKFAEDLKIRLLPYLASDEYMLMVSVSRRTPATVIAKLRHVFDGKNCHFWAGEEDGENPYMAYLYYADAVLVTEDSTSMLSDACATGKPVFRLPLKGGSDKFNRLYQVLQKRCHVSIFEGDLKSEPYEPLSDAQTVADEIKKRFEIADIKR
jgi:mitochondrial fission protein ELM1